MNLKQLYLILEDILLMHPEVNSVTRLSVSDYIANRSKVYTNANIVYVSKTIQDKYDNYTFLVTISDRLLTDGSNETEIINNSLLIAEDFFTQLSNSYDYDFQKNVNIQQFTNSDGDLLAGIYFQINIKVLRTQSPCIVPVTEISPFPLEFPIEFN